MHAHGGSVAAVGHTEALTPSMRVLYQPMRSPALPAFRRTAFPTCQSMSVRTLRLSNTGRPPLCKAIGHARQARAAGRRPAVLLVRAP